MLTGQLLFRSAAKHACGDSHLHLTFLLVTVGCLLFSQGTYALDPAKELSQYGHTAWRLQEGALPGAPAAIAQTQDGYMWIGTQAGLLRFDGAQFSSWSPPRGQQLTGSSASVMSLLGARDGSLWIGTLTGLSRWKDQKLTNYVGSIAAIESIFEDRTGRIWITRSRVRDLSGPLCDVSGNDLRCYGSKDGIPVNAADPIFEDQEGHLWFGGNGALIRWSTGVPAVYPLQKTTTQDDSRSINGAVLTTDAGILIGVSNVGKGLGLQQFLPGGWKAFTKPGLDGATLEVITMFVDRQQSVWVGTSNDGIYRIHGEAVDHFGRADGLSGESVQAIFEDREGNVWVATSSGLDVFRDARIATFGMRHGLTSGYAFSVAARRDGSVWAGNRGGLDFLAPNARSFQSIRAGLPGRQVRALFEDKAGNLWVSVDRGIFIYEGGRFRPILNPISDNKTVGVISFAEDLQGTVWAVLAGTTAGILRIQDFTLKELIPTSRVSGAFSVVPDNKGGVWVSLQDGNLAHYAGGTWQTISLDQSDGKRNLFNIFVDSEGAVWGASPRGLLGYKEGRFALLTQQNGLPCNFTYSLTSDSNGALWIFGECGLMTIRKTELARLWDGSDTAINVEHLGRLDGAQPGVPLMHPGAAMSSDGRLWFANGVGLQMVHPEGPGRNSHPPPVHIERLVADDKDYALARATLPAQSRDVQIDYTALSFVLPQRVFFRYRLEGRDTNWQDAGTRRQAFYSDLPPGNYTFRVIASNNDGVWNNEGAAVTFSVAPAWFQTPWFRTLSVGLLLSSLALMYQLRLRQLRRRFDATLDARVAERTRIARELHDTLLQTVHGSRMVADHALKDSSDHPRMVRAMEQLAAWLGKATEEGRAALNSLRSTPDLTDDLEGALRHAVDECRKSNAANISVTSQGSARQIRPVVRDEIYRIGYEGLRNACAHSGGDRVEVSIDYGDELTLRVSDNGTGIDAVTIETGRKGHFGLPGMRERAERIGAQFTLTSEPSMGTVLTVTVPGRLAFLPE